MLSVAAVLLLHELIHATTFYLSQRVPPQLGWRGLMIFASAPGILYRPVPMMLNVLASFTVITVLGLMLITWLLTSFLPGSSSPSWSTQPPQGEISSPFSGCSGCPMRR